MVIRLSFHCINVANYYLVSSGIPTITELLATHIVHTHTHKMTAREAGKDKIKTNLTG